MVDFTAIAHDYIWMGFVKLVMAAYSIGGLQFTIGLIIGILTMLFFGFFKKIVVWILILFVISSIAIGIIASDVSWQDIKNGNWTGKVKVSEEKYQQTKDKVTNDVYNYGQQQVAQYAEQQWLNNNTWQTIS